MLPSRFILLIFMDTIGDSSNCIKCPVPIELSIFNFILNPVITYYSMLLPTAMDFRPRRSSTPIKFTPFSEGLRESTETGLDELSSGIALLKSGQARTHAQITSYKSHRHRYSTNFSEIRERSRLLREQKMREMDELVSRRLQVVLPTTRTPHPSSGSEKSVLEEIHEAEGTEGDCWGTGPDHSCSSSGSSVFE